MGHASIWLVQAYNAVERPKSGVVAKGISGASARRAAIHEGSMIMGRWRFVEIVDLRCDVWEMSLSPQPLPTGIIVTGTTVMLADTLSGFPSQSVAITVMV
jgi:hypothetical protein